MCLAMFVVMVVCVLMAVCVLVVVCVCVLVCVFVCLCGCVRMFVNNSQGEPFRVLFPINY